MVSSDSLTSESTGCETAPHLKSGDHLDVHRDVDVQLSSASARQKRLKTTPSLDARNSLVLWHKTVFPGKVMRNGLFIVLARYSPSLALKRLLYRTIGMQVGSNVSFAFQATPDLFFPEYISVADNTIIGYNTTILAHEYLIHEWRVGPVRIGSNVIIGANCTILPGVVIGDGAIISAMSLVNKDVPPGARVGGIPIRLLDSENTECKAIAEK